MRLLAEPKCPSCQKALNHKDPGFRADERCVHCGTSLEPDPKYLLLALVVGAVLGNMLYFAFSVAALVIAIVVLALFARFVGIRRWRVRRSSLR